MKKIVVMLMCLLMLLMTRVSGCFSASSRE